MSLVSIPDLRPRPSYDPEAAHALDRALIARAGLGGFELMQRAGHAAFVLLRQLWPAARSVCVWCGTGNNGGDGLILARSALEAGWDVHVHLLTDPHHLSNEAREAWACFNAAGGEIVHDPLTGESAADVHVDALFGIGLTRPVDGIFAAAVERINAAGRPVLSLDIPSGLCARTGQVLGVAVHAHATLSFIALKSGQCTGAASTHQGALWLADLNIPDPLPSECKPCAWLEPAGPIALPRRARHAHKGDFGHVLVVGGNLGMAGAARLAGEAALRSGAGCVSIATRPEHTLAMIQGCPELMAHSAEHPDALQPLLQRATRVAIGPGLGQDEWGRALFRMALASGKPLVVDADALNLLAAAHCRRDDWILTPHPGEAAHLLGVPTREVLADRYAAVHEIQARFGGVVVLKGAGTLIASTDALPRVCLAGNPGMATAGMGDVLTGIIAALAAQDLDLASAAILGVRAHAAAGDWAARAGERGLIARDLFPHLRTVLNA